MNTVKKLDELTGLSLSFIKELEGERVAGTEGEKRAKKVIEKYIDSMGLSFEEETFELYVSKNLRGHIIAGGKRIEARPYGLTVPYEVKGRLVYFDHPEEALALSQDIKEKICLFAVSPDHSYVKKLKDRGCRGFIVASPPSHKLYSRHLRQKAIEEDAILPGASVLYDDAIKLLNMEGEEVSMKGEGKTEKVEATNIIVEVTGAITDTETVVVTGHYDTVPFSPGFSDNGGGVAIMVSLIRHFKENSPDRTLKFAFFSGEEWGLCGSMSYVKAHSEDLENIMVGLNLDVAGCPVGRLVGQITGSESLLHTTQSIVKSRGLFVDFKKGIYSSDSIPFAMKNVPFVNLARIGGKANRYIHTEDDRGFYYAKKGFEKHIKASISILSFFANAETIPFEKKIDDDVKKKLDEYIQKRL